MMTLLMLLDIHAVAVQLSQGDHSSAVDVSVAAASGSSFPDAGAAWSASRAAAAGAAPAAQRSYRPGVPHQWPTRQASAAGATAIPDEMDSNGNEINSNIYPDNANLQAANQQAGSLNPANQRLDGAHAASQSSET